MTLSEMRSRYYNTWVQLRYIDGYTFYFEAGDGGLQLAAGGQEDCLPLGEFDVKAYYRVTDIERRFGRILWIKQYGQVVYNALCNANPVGEEVSVND